MISLTVKKFGYVRYLVEFVNLCLKEIDELKKKKQTYVGCKLT